MAMHDALSLSRTGRVLGSFPLDDGFIEVGSDPSCDIAVHSSSVADRALLVQAHGGTVYVYDLAADPGLRNRSVLPVGQPWPLGTSHCVVRTKVEALPRACEGTELLERRDAGTGALSLVSGKGSGARAHHIGDGPISVGSARDNALVLTDRAVSRYHCRLEPRGRGLVVRDLGSTNGTWVDGARVQVQALRPGAVLGLGRSELRVVCRGDTPGIDGEAVTASPSMLAVMAEVDRFAHVPWPVLIRGETGVGKEHVARALHARGPRSAEPFIALNGGGLARELVESELFGHERGAFTGALQAHRGAFEQAHGGTLFLDEVAELPLELQTRLLRVLETWEVRRVGSEIDRCVDVRLICATHDDLRAEVRRGRFRADLFYRIHRLVLEVPPLRARQDDIRPLAEHFLRQMRPAVGLRELHREAVERLRGHPWPGNVRELRNVLELAAIDSEPGEIDASAIERALRRTGEAPTEPPAPDMLREALEHYGGNVSAAARALGMPRSTLRDRLKSVP